MQKIVLLTLLSVFSFVKVAAEDFPAKSNPPSLVNDYTGTLDNKEIHALESKLVTFNQETSTQLTIVMVKSLNGYDKADYAQRLAQQWGIGQKDKNNGILILVKPKTASSRGEAFIAVGYGLEGVVPDATAWDVVNREMIPRFKENDIAGGLDAATNVLIDLTRGEFTAEQYANAGKSGSKGGGIIALLIMIFVIRALFSGSRGRHHTMGRSSSVLPWLFMGTMMGGSRSGSSFSNFSGGSGSFGGFGGGSFGGGGAGGSW